MVALADEVRPEAQKAIADCKKAGIEVVMITGDHKDTAIAIANKIGIWGEGALAVTGNELKNLTNIEFENIVEKIKVYARVSPEQKLTIIKALQNKKYFVAMTGDGVNDAPALKAANIGVAMGINGTDVSKQAASMILLDDNFATIVKAVKEGRKIYDNITKFIIYILSGNLGEIFTIVFAIILGFPIPLLPIHILWVNLVTDGLPGIALATLPAENDLMQHKPTNTQKSIFTRQLNIQVLLSGFVIAVCCLVTQYIGLKYNLPYWQTMVFLVLCFSQMANVLSIASNKLFYKIKPSKFTTLFATILLTLVLQILITYLPVLNNVFHTNPIPWQHFVLCILASAVIFVVLEAKKIIHNKHVGI